jgi:hypothetical protein
MAQRPAPGRRRQSAKLREEPRIDIQANGEAEFLIFDLPGA